MFTRFKRKSEQEKMFESLRENFGEPAFVLLRHLCDADSIKIDLVFLMQRRPSFSMVKPADEGMIARTSRSPVGFENPYPC